VLLEHGADPLTKNKAMRTPLKQINFIGVSDRALAPLLANWERRYGGGDVHECPKRERLLGWRSILLAFVLAAIMVRYLTMAVEKIERLNL
jgi:hypothetical protein